jgi:hypothetical protein
MDNEPTPLDFHAAIPSEPTKDDDLHTCRECGISEEVSEFDSSRKWCRTCYDWLGSKPSVIRNCGVPERHRVFSDWKMLTEPDKGRKEWADVIRVVRRFICAEFGSVLLMIGTRGTGKTQIACCAVMEVIHRCRRVARYTRLVSVLADLKSRYRADGDGDAGWLIHWSRPYLLVIDEAACKPDTAWSSMMLSSLIDVR